MADAKQDVNNGPSHQSRVVLAKPRLGGFSSSGFGASSSSKTSNPFGSVLRPPQLKPTSNPFLKVTEEKNQDKSLEETKEPESKVDRLKEDEGPPIFMPLGTSNVSSRNSNPVPAPAQPTASSASFVFGQNLSERVVMKENVNNGDSDPDHSSSNGTSELLFSSAASTVKENNQEEAGPSGGSGGGEGLAAAAAEYERSHARPPPPTSTVTMTGEEEETNVLQISCRLFAWEAGSWRERGRGVLRLNDGSDGARLVARVAGSLRVVLNTKLWPEMVVERAGARSLRITAADVQQQVKLFLIMGAPADIVHLNRALLSRIAVSKPSSSKQNSTSQEAAERLDNDYEEKQNAEGPEDYLDEDERTNETTDAAESNENLDNKDTKTLKRKEKEPASEETSPKRQCPKILVE